VVCNKLAQIIKKNEKKKAQDIAAGIVLLEGDIDGE